MQTSTHKSGLKKFAESQGKKAVHHKGNATALGHTDHALLMLPS